MNARETRSRLLEQHDHLRAHLQICVRLARQFREGESVGEELDLTLDLLRGELAEHNATEAAAIRHLLHGPSAWSSLVLDRMVEEHIAEHAAFEDLLSGTRAEVAARIEDLAEELDAHMAAEERTVLSPQTLHDEVLRKRTREDIGT